MPLAQKADLSADAPRSAGVLLHISSLSSAGGIGTLGKEAFRFVDFLYQAGQKWWQILPIGPTSYGDSPYQSFSSFAGNPYFIDPELLIEQGLLTEQEFFSFDFGTDAERVDYEKLYQNRYRMLDLACDRFDAEDPAFLRFLREESWWLEDYALFTALKTAHGGKPWYEWEDDLRLRRDDALQQARQTYACELQRVCIRQFLFRRQWRALKAYANEHGIHIIGDMPIYSALDSADVWANPKVYQLNEDLLPTEVAGCPPDAFSEDGQRWGNPLYDWDYIKQTDYDWWCKRLGAAADLFDVVRIDHFRGFAGYYAIPAEDDHARNGCWRDGPGLDLFETLRRKIGRVPIIAEDLGFLTEDVHQLLADCGFPGIKVLQFAFDSREESDYLPYLYPENCVVYTGTHDNDTVLGWISSLGEEEAAYTKDYLRLTDRDGAGWGMMKEALASRGKIAILTMQDLLSLGSEARMNTPSTLGGNWCWRMRGECVNDWLAGMLHHWCEVYHRLPEPPQPIQISE